MNHLLDWLQASEEVDTSHLQVSHPISDAASTSAIANHAVITGERPVERYCKISKLKHNFRLPNDNQAHAPCPGTISKNRKLDGCREAKNDGNRSKLHINCKKFGATSSCDLNCFSMIFGSLGNLKQENTIKFRVQDAQQIYIGA
jgi:hypothetical protein